VLFTAKHVGQMNLTTADLPSMLVQDATIDKPIKNHPKETSHFNKREVFLNRPSRINRVVRHWGPVQSSAYSTDGMGAE
jgi:hypothetical protein